MTTEPGSELEAIVARVFDVPARLLFEAYSKCEHIKRWFGPVGWPVTFCEMDFRVGGTYRFAMTGPDGKQATPFGGTYLAIEPNRRLVYDDGFEAPGAEKMTVTVTFDERPDGKTLLTIRYLFPSQEMYDEHVGGGIEEGTNSGLDQLEELVREMGAA